MPVAGYNVIPDENDDHVIGVEIETANEYHKGKACIYIDEEEIHLDWYELKAFIHRCKQVVNQMEWAQATYVHLAGLIATDKTHLQHKGDDPHGKALCGQMPMSWGILSDRQKAWDQSPVIGDPGSTNTCKRCYARWQKEQHGENEGTDSRT